MSAPLTETIKLKPYNLKTTIVITEDAEGQTFRIKHYPFTEAVFDVVSKINLNPKIQHVQMTVELTYKESNIPERHSTPIRIPRDPEKKSIGKTQISSRHQNITHFRPYQNQKQSNKQKKAN